MNFCKDCKHMSANGNAMDGTCENPKSENFRDPVTGNWPSAGSMRYEGFLGPGEKKREKRCGDTGAWFDAKEGAL